MKHFFTIIGGMGTLATEAYIHLLNKETPAHCDQDYLNYILVNNATIPDRTAYIKNHKRSNPLKPLIEDIRQQNKLHPDFYTLPCNTAHYFYYQLQNVANAPILHMPKETVHDIKEYYPKAHRIGLIATQGTIDDKVYDMAVKNTSYQLIKPTKKLEKQVMFLIYKDVKDNNYANKKRYLYIISTMLHQMHCDVVILGCTELSLVQERLKCHIPVIDAQDVLAKHTIKLALKYQRKADK